MSLDKAINLLILKLISDLGQDIIKNRRHQKQLTRTGTYLRQMLKFVDNFKSSDSLTQSWNSCLTLT
jgi:hypothetical protein